MPSDGRKKRKKEERKRRREEERKRGREEEKQRGREEERKRRGEAERREKEVDTDVSCEERMKGSSLQLAAKVELKQ